MSIIFLFKEYSLREIGCCDVQIKSGGIALVLSYNSFPSAVKKYTCEKMLIVFLIKESSQREISVLIRLQGRKEERRPPCYFQFLGWADVRRCRRRFVLETQMISLFFLLHFSLAPVNLT